MQTYIETPPSNLVFQVMPYEVEVTAACTDPFEQAVDRELIRQACDRRRNMEEVDIYLARDGTCYGRVAKNRTYLLDLPLEKAQLVANWVQGA